MSVIDTARERLADKATGVAIPADVDERVRRGRREMMRGANNRKLCAYYEKGDTYWFETYGRKLDQLSTASDPSGGGRPPHRVRNRYNFIRPIVEAKVSAATQRIPSYDISPSTNDSADEGAARLASQVALYGYDKWAVREVSIDVCKLAIGCGGDGFAMPYFDPNVGPYVQLADGSYQGQGEIKILTLSGNEVYWEPGVKFRDSRWYVIERARPIDDVKEMPGYVGGKLTPDASVSDMPTDAISDGNLVMVREYLERPCPKYPHGRRIVMCGGRVIVDPRQLDPTTPAEGPWEPYPLMDAHGQVLDEPVLHRVKYTHDTSTDRDFGLTWQLIDFQRTAQDAMNKMVEWKNRCLVPQIMAPVGSNIGPRTDAPGDIIYYRPVGGQRPEWEQVQPIPDSLFRIKNEALSDMRSAAQDIDLDAYSNAAAKALQAGVEQSSNRWQTFLGDLAEFHSRLMRHCLLLVQRYYTEPRLLNVRGRYGPYPVSNFLGAQIMGEMDVTVLPGSLTVRSRQEITQQIMTFAQLGWIDGQTAMAAIQAGNAENLIEGFELDVARANRIVQKIRDGSVMSMPSTPMTDPSTGQPVMQPVNGPDGQPLIGANGVPVQEVAEVPGWMPRDFDSPQVWKHVLSDFLKTEEYEGLPESMQAVAQTIYDGILKTQADQEARAAAAQTAQAQALGAANAAKPQAQQMPSLPGSGITPLAGAPPA